MAQHRGRYSTLHPTPIGVLVPVAVMVIWPVSIANGQARRPILNTAGNPRHKLASANSSGAKSGNPLSYISMQNKDAMRITLKASRGQATAGSSFGITAEIENTSDRPIYIMPSAIAMTVPPELATNGVQEIWASIPGIQTPPGQDYWSTVVVLEPGSTTSAYWSSGNASSSTTNRTNSTWLEKSCAYLGIKCGKFIGGIGFSPGPYTVNVVGSYWDTYEGAQKKGVERHTETAEMQETITAPQSVILFGAALGGIIAFLLLSKLQPDSSSGWGSVKWGPGVLSAVLLSTIVTILISRLSQSQFIISVTVNDLWGAIAVGFIVTAAGPTILRKFTGIVNTSGGSSPKNPLSQAIAPNISAGKANGNQADGVQEAGT